jgi:hypothetical protein
MSRKKPVDRGLVSQTARLKAENAVLQRVAEELTTTIRQLQLQRKSGLLYVIDKTPAATPFRMDVGTGSSAN